MVMTETEAVRAAQQLIETSGWRVGPFLGAHCVPAAMRHPDDADRGDLWIVGFDKLYDNENETIECVYSVTTVTVHDEDATGEARFLYAM